MAEIEMLTEEYCNLCGMPVNKTDGITVKCSDTKGLKHFCINPVPEEREYKVRICGRCVINITDYCKKHAHWVR